MYLLLGYGRSNQSIEKYFIKENIEYLIYDDYKFKDKINLDNIKIIIKSNGINNDHDLLNEAKKGI